MRKPESQFLGLTLLLLSLSCLGQTSSQNDTNPWLQAIQLQQNKLSQPSATAHLNALTDHSNAIQAAKPSQKLHIPKTAPVKSSTNSGSGKNQHLWNLKDVDILKVIAEISRETGKNFVINPQVTGKVTLISSTPLSADEIYQAFLSTLGVLGYAAVPSGNIIKIIPTRDASREGRIMTSHIPIGDTVVVQVIPLRYVSAIQLVPILNPLVPTWASVSAVSTANTLVISGTSTVVARITSIVSRIDTPAANGVDVVPLQYATAEDVSKELVNLIQSARSYGETVNAAVSADDESNSIMLTGNASTRLRLKVLISQLDQSGANGLGDTQVISLHYIQVQDILPILRGIAKQNSTITAANTPLTPANPTTNNGSNSSGGLNSDYDGFTNQVQSITNAELNSGAITGDSSKQQTVITGDVTNNALIITAPTAMMNKLKNVISRLDIRPEQVLVQGIIAEVDASKARNLGIQWGSAALAGADSSGNTPLGPTAPFPATGGLGVGFIQAGDLRGLVELLGSDSSSNILSTPSITVLNNGHADIEVGKTFSETTGQYQPTGQTNNNPFVQYQDKNVGLILRVTPQITGDNSIRLAIDQTNSSIISDSSTLTSGNAQANPNPSTNQEKISTTVLVNDGQVLVLGGLINSQKEKITTQVPIIGDIPLIGWLFKHDTDQNIKKDLLVFLRPIVITDPTQASQISKARYDFIRDREILSEHDMSQYDASSTLMSQNKMELPVPFSKTDR